ncbi:CAP domain-containing protein [Chloroflexota bacterium]
MKFGFKVNSVISIGILILVLLPIRVLPVPLPDSIYPPRNGQPIINKDNSQHRSQNLNSGFSSTSYYWEKLTLPDGVTIDNFRDLAVHPQDATIVYLATRTQLYRSDDAGESWTQINLYHPNLFGIAIAASNPQRMYLSGEKFLRSDDGGISWYSFDSSKTLCMVNVAPSDEDILYGTECSFTSTVYKSIDGGQTWTIPDEDFIPPGTFSNFKIAVHPTNPELLIVSNCYSLYKSVNGGENWTKVQVQFKSCLTYPIFSNKPPYNIFIGHSSGLIRSIDNGSSFESGNHGREFWTIIDSPWDSDVILGGSSEGSWKISSEENTWIAGSWNAPLQLIRLWSSVVDHHMLYARSSTSIWRYVEQTKNWPEGVFLPIISKDETVNENAEAYQARKRANYYRGIVGVYPLRPHDAIITAAQNHANYYMLNYKDSSAFTDLTHGEVEGKPGFTGKLPGDRMYAAGFPWIGTGEVMSFRGDPLKSVDSWMSTVYHRFSIIDPNNHYTGYGFGRSKVENVDVMNFGFGPTNSGFWYSDKLLPLAYPVDGQVGVPTSWNGGERPNPLPPGASTPVGYPFTLQVHIQDLIINTIVMKDQVGQEVSVHPNPPNCQFGCYALIPVKPLQEHTTYTVHATGFIYDIPFDRTWTFTTGG